MRNINNYDYESLLSELNEIAQNGEPYEYGLPLYDAGQKSLLRDAVLRWLQKQMNTSAIEPK